MTNNTQTEYATGGANAQDGALPIRTCKNCQSDIVWVTSARTGKCYPVNISYGRSNQRFYVKTNFHKCDEVIAARTEYAAFSEAEQTVNVRIAGLTKLMMLMHKAMADGDMAQVAAYEAILADEDALISLGESALAEAGAQA